jgi:hypothetical protein
MAKKKSRDRGQSPRKEITISDSSLSTELVSDIEVQVGYITVSACETIFTGVRTMGTSLRLE